MKRISILLTICLLANMGAWAQDETPYRVIDTTMVFSEADFTTETTSRGLNAFVHVNYPDDPTFTLFAQWTGEHTWLMAWSPIFTLQQDERIATADCVSCELEDEVLFMEHPQLRGDESASIPYGKDSPLQPCYAFQYRGPGRTLGRSLHELAAKSDEFDYLCFVRQLMVKVCPFRYDCQTDKLYLYRKVRVKIRLAERPMNRYEQEGYVRDQDGHPLANAVLTVNGDKEYLTDSDGHYKIVVETWDSEVKYSLKVTADDMTSARGYLSVSFPISVFNHSATKDFQLYNTLSFKAGELCTIMLPVIPDKSLGRYFQLDRVEDGNIVFEREFAPKAYCPYILIPDRNESVALTNMDLRQDTVVMVCDELNQCAFVGSSYSAIAYYSQNSKCYPIDQKQSNPIYVEAMHAALYYPYFENWGLILHDPTDVPTAIHDTPAQQIVNGKSLNGKCYDLSGRLINNGQWKMGNGKLPRGVYIKDGRKMVVR